MSESKLTDMKHGDKLYTVVEGRDGMVVESLTCVDAPGFERVYAKASSHHLSTKVWELVTVKESLIGTYSCPWYYSRGEACIAWEKGLRDALERKIQLLTGSLKPLLPTAEEPK